MKLVRCLECHFTIVPESRYETTCPSCLGCQAQYLKDGRTLEVVGPCVVIGLRNDSLQSAIRRWEETREWPLGTKGRTAGLNFEAWVIPEQSQWVKRVDELTSTKLAREERNAARREARRKKTRK
jgi:hypothetical protein